MLINTLKQTSFKKKKKSYLSCKCLDYFIISVCQVVRSVMFLKSECDECDKCEGF